MSPDEARLYRRCDEALHYLWDPIGVSDIPEARDEYESYLPRAYAYVLSGDRDGLVSYLTAIGSENMGLAPNPDSAIRAADYMLRTRDWIREQSSS